MTEQNKSDGNLPKRPSPWVRERPVGDALRQEFREVEAEAIPENLTRMIEKFRREAASKA